MDIVYAALLLVAPCYLVALYLGIRAQQLRSSNARKRTQLLTQLGIPPAEAASKKIVGFFHPYCNAGGGGERVLWTAIAFVQRTDPDVVSVVYSGDVDASKEEIIANVKRKFDIDLSPATLDFVFLNSRWAVEDATWPRFTLLGQSLGSMYLAWEAISKFVPDLYIDTMGYAFTFHVLGLLGVPAGAYVHYPTISTDMIARVKSGKDKAWEAAQQQTMKRRVKLLYYRFVMHLYAQALRQAKFLMVNSSWTRNHVAQIVPFRDPLLGALELLTSPLVLPLHILKVILPSTPAPAPALLSAAGSTPEIVYPPCDTREMAQFSLDGRERVILSIQQFRPEKDHTAQLRAFAHLLSSHPEYRGAGKEGVKLVLIGGSRNSADAMRVEGLKELARELGVEAQVTFLVNAPYPEMLGWLARASVGVNTMVDEHFGINVVEYMASGLIPVTHASGGPLNDIVVPFAGQPTGFHATTPEAYAEAFHKALALPADEEHALRQRARSWAVQRFSAEEFERGWSASGWKAWL